MSSNPTRRVITAALGALPFAPSLAAGASAPKLEFGAAEPFSWETLKRRARTVGAAPYKAPDGEDTALLQTLDAKAASQIRFRPELALWSDIPGAQRIRFFPLSRNFPEAVRVFVVEGAAARELIYRPSVFDAPPDSPLWRLKAGGFAGLRLMNGERDSDWLAFLGASYFRASGPFDQFGASARGLAIDAGGPGTEEFPRFNAFWLERLPGGAVRTYALLESPSVAGAYRIDNRQTPQGPVQEVEAELRFRRAVPNLGLAPLTSMYWRGQVHDSDGLEIWTGQGERIWRPLGDPDLPTLNSFLDQDPKGFGLIQRDRAAADYQDAPMFYDKRPSLWVEPLAPFGKGSVRLLELPTTADTNDNIGAYWSPAASTKAGAVMTVRYRLHWSLDAPPITPLCRIVGVRVGAPRPGVTHVEIDLEGDVLAGLDGSSGVSAQASSSVGVIDALAVSPASAKTAWRIAFDVLAPSGRTADLRAFLRRGDQALSETWLYQIRT